MNNRFRSLVSAFLRDPLVHFVLLGAVIFGLYNAVSGDGGRQRDSIVVTEGRIESLATTFAKTWQRAPTQEELQGLIRDYVREEACAREAASMGLDQDDPIIRRRLRQKVEFLLQDTSVPEPSDAELEQYLQAHAGQFRHESEFTFQQVYLDPHRRGDALSGDADRLLAQLNVADAKLDPSTVGDSQLLASTFVARTRGEISRDFGEDFAARLETMPIGQWQGPVESGYGAHLLRISERKDGRMPELAEIRVEVRREWERAKRVGANELFYEALLKRYPVTIERSKVQDAALNRTEKPQQQVVNPPRLQLSGRELDGPLEKR